MALTLNRRQRRWLEYQNPRRGFGVEGSATTLKKTEVAVEPGLGVAPEEELLILGGLRLLKEKHPQVELTYLSPTEEIPLLLKNAFFLKSAHHVTSDEARDRLLGNTYRVTLDSPDPLEAYQAEENDYKKWFAAEKAEKEEQQRAYDMLGVKDIKVQMPVYAYEPQWHKSNAFLWKLVDTLGLPLKIPTKALPPFGTLPASAMKARQRQLEKIVLSTGKRLASRSFVVCDFAHEPAAMALLGAAMKVFADYQVVTLQQVVKETDESLTTLLSLCHHPNCEYVICPVGPLATCAWAAEVPNIFQLYQGGNSLWDGTHARNEYALDRDKFSDQELPRAVEYALGILRQRLDLL